MNEIKTLVKWYKSLTEKEKIAVSKYMKLLEELSNGSDSKELLKEQEGIQQQLFYITGVRKHMGGEKK